MEPTPRPFVFAAAPSGLLGRAFDPQLPPVGGYSDLDLDQLRLTLAKSGSDPGRLARVKEIMARRAAMQAGLLPPQPPAAMQPSGKPGVVDGILGARQRLLDSLSQ